jgi:DNA-binding XRE family transcriptional regulator
VKLSTFSLEFSTFMVTLDNHTRRAISPMPPIQLLFAERLKFYRKMKKLTQAQIADKLNLSIRYYQKIESGKQNIKISLVDEISKILQINRESLLTLHADILKEE